MNKKIIFGFIILSLLLIAGCTGGSRNKSPITDVDVRKGTDGLIMQFTKNAPPERVFEESIFPIAVILRNRGASDIEPVSTLIDVEVTKQDGGGEYKDFDKQLGTVEGKLVFGFETTFVDLSEEVKVKSLESEKNSLENERSQLKDKRKMLGDEINDLQGEEGTEDFGDRLDEIDEELIEIKVRIDEINARLIEIPVELIDARKELNLIENDFKLDEIKGKSIFSPNGDQELITINARTKRIGTQSETQPSTILATACYPYKTIFGSSVCIDTDIYGTRRGQKVCSIKDLKFSEGQGAPVAITKIETRMLPQDNNLVKPHFLIHIENKGNGEVVELKVEQACTSERLDYRSFNTIIIKASLSGKPLDCRIKKRGPDADPPPPAPPTISPPLSQAAIKNKKTTPKAINVKFLFRLIF